MDYQVCERQLARTNGIFLFTCRYDDVHLPCEQRIHTNFTANLLHGIYIYYVYCV
jgi:hypothetical protein